MIVYGFTVGIRIGAGAESIRSSGADTLPTPGEGGGGGGGGATVGGHAGGPAHKTSHWLTQPLTFDPSSGPASPFLGHPQPPEPDNWQGPQPPFSWPSLSS